MTTSNRDEHKSELLYKAASKLVLCHEPTRLKLILPSKEILNLPAAHKPDQDAMAIFYLSMHEGIPR